MYSFSGVRDLSPNFHVHVSQDRSTYFLQHRQIDITRSQTYEIGNCDCGRAIPFLEHLFRIFGIGSLHEGLAPANCGWIRWCRCFVYILVIQQQQQQLGLSEARSWAAPSRYNTRYCDKTFLNVRVSKCNCSKTQTSQNVRTHHKT